MMKAFARNGEGFLSDGTMTLVKHVMVKDSYVVDYDC